MNDTSITENEELYMAYEAHKAGDYEIAFSLFQALAEQEVATAQFMLAIMYEKGNGVSRDYTEALKWYERAAEQGNGSAQFSLAIIYRDGKWVSKNNKKAAKLFRKAAEEGLAAAQFMLGVMYMKGEGVAKSDIKACMWFNIAAANGDEDAEEWIKMVEENMFFFNITKAQKLAKQCRESNYQNCGK